MTDVVVFSSSFGGLEILHMGILLPLVVALSELLMRLRDVFRLVNVVGCTRTFRYRL